MICELLKNICRKFGSSFQGDLRITGNGKGEYRVEIYRYTDPYTICWAPFWRSKHERGYHTSYESALDDLRGIEETREDMELQKFRPIK